MSAFKNWFSKSFGAACPIAGLPAMERIEDNVWVSANLKDDPPSKPMTPDFPNVDGDYVIAGLWGRGIGSYGFYFIEVRGPHRRFFRLNYGSAYGDTDEDSKKLVEYLAGYQKWRSAHETRLEGSTLVHNMGVNQAEVNVGQATHNESKTAADAGSWWADLTSSAAAWSSGPVGG